MGKLTAQFLSLMFLALLWNPVHAKDSNVYRDVERKLTLTIPKGWEALPQHSGTLVLALIKRTPLKPFNPSIIISFLDAFLPMPENRKQLESIVSSISGPSENIPNIENFKVTGSAIDKKKGEAAFLYRATYNLKRVKIEKDRKVTTLNYIYREQDHYVALNLVVPTAEIKAYEKTFWPVLASLKFE